jgi:tRNA A-37 threonylcarbamoyl transferase component Bud32
MLPNKNKAEFDVFIQGAQVLEQDGFGLKVLRLPGDRILKLFRRKRRLSSQIWAPHAWRFKRNAKILHKRGIPTISIESIFAIPDLQRQAVLYHELPGVTLRQWLDEHDGERSQAQIEAFARFVALLHDQGILFRSLHLGNVLVTTDGALALIDIVDMGFRWFGPLTLQQRIRNFKHVGRYVEDRARLAKSGEGVFMRAYLKTSAFSQNKRTKLTNAFQSSCA